MMAKLQQEYAGKPEVQFVSFTVDPGAGHAASADGLRAQTSSRRLALVFFDRPTRSHHALDPGGFHLAVAALPVDADPAA